MYDSGYLNSLEAGTVRTLCEIHAFLFKEIYMKEIDNSYLYEGYPSFLTDEV